MEGENAQIQGGRKHWPKTVRGGKFVGEQAIKPQRVENEKKRGSPPVRLEENSKESRTRRRRGKQSSKIPGKHRRTISGAGKNLKLRNVLKGAIIK